MNEQLRNSPVDKNPNFVGRRLAVGALAALAGLTVANVVRAGLTEPKSPAKVKEACMIDPDAPLRTVMIDGFDNNNVATNKPGVKSFRSVEAIADLIIVHGENNAIPTNNCYLARIAVINAAFEGVQIEPNTPINPGKLDNYNQPRLVGDIATFPSQMVFGPVKNAQ